VRLLSLDCGEASGATLSLDFEVQESGVSNVASDSIEQMKHFAELAGVFVGREK